MKNILLLFFGYISLTNCQSHDKLVCAPGDDTADGGKTAICSPLSPKGALKLPDQINDEAYLVALTINVINVRQPFLLDSIDTFKRFSKLKTLILKIDTELIILHKQPIEELKLYSLTEFIWNNEASSAEEMTKTTLSIKLPETVTKVIFVKSQLQCDLTQCSNLKIFNCTECGISKLPKFFDPDPPLVALNLRRNDLTQFTVNDLARFCLLKELVIKEHKIEPCQCKYIDKWIEKLKKLGDFVFEGSLSCANTDKCPENNLEEAEKIRKACIERRTSSVGYLFYFLLVIFILAIISAGVWFAYWLHKRVFWDE